MGHFLPFLTFQTFGRRCLESRQEPLRPLVLQSEILHNDFEFNPEKMVTGQHHAVAIIPTSDPDASETFYARLGFRIVSDYGHYRILADSRGWHLHLTQVQGWPKKIDENPFGLYLYVDDVDAVAEQVRDLIIEPGTPHRKPWGTYEFAVSDPSGTLVRIGRVAD